MRNTFQTVIKILLVIFVAIMLIVLITLLKEDYDTTENLDVEVTDVLGRRVVLPSRVDSIVCLKASAIRLVCYAGGADKICGVEECELRDAPYTHLFANPHLRTLRSVGPMMGGDPELILIANPDLIFVTCTTVSEADFLQRRTGIPVVALDYGDLGRGRSLFDQSLRVIGEVLGTQSRVESLITYIDGQIDELANRSENSDNEGQPAEVYVCGISYKGNKGATSTDPYYPALEFIGASNVARGVKPDIISSITGTIVNPEQLLLWNPDVIFADHNGLELVKSDMKRWGMESAELHVIWPYNNIHSNFEVMLLNGWYIGKVLYPDNFSDISIQCKCNEIMEWFLQAPIRDSLVAEWGDYSLI